jgi:rSAM/selenodomain-associated transferase 1
MITVLVVAKAPNPGRAKTRLVPPLTVAQATDLQRCLLLDTVAGCRAQADDVRLLVAQPAEYAPLSRLLPDVPIVVQRGRGLADALRLGVADHANDGVVAIVSSDLPGIPRGSIARAEAALADGADIVLGPATDGGYWLVAMREAHDAPFRDIPWSTPAVQAVTLERCRAAGLRVAELDRWRDVDTYADVLAAAAAPCEGSPSRTAVLLAAWTRSGIVADEIGPEPISSRLLHASPWRAMLSDGLRRPDGRTVDYTYVAVPRAVFIVAVTRANELLLVRQYRHPVRDFTLEVPAGSVEDGETAREAAERELLEEVGGRSNVWRHLSTFYSSSAHLSLRSDDFVATSVEVDDPSIDADEPLRTVRVPLAVALESARAGGFVEGQTALSILLAAPHLERSGPSRP